MIILPHRSDRMCGNIRVIIRDVTLKFYIVLRRTRFIIRAEDMILTPMFISNEYASEFYIIPFLKEYILDIDNRP